MGSFFIVEGQIFADTRPRLRHVFVGMQIDFLIFDGAPKPLDKDIVAPGSLAVHRDFNARLFQHIGEGDAGELAALIRVENLRFAISK